MMYIAPYYDYERQAFVENGRYIRCAHSESMDCQCYGKLHEGETAPTYAELSLRSWQRGIPSEFACKN